MRKSKYTREVLAPIVAEASSLADVIRRLGLEPTGGNWRYIRARVRHLELDTSHFFGAVAKRIAKLTREDLADLVAASTSVAQVASALGLALHGGTHTRLSARIKKLALDTSHFRGSAWSRGETRDTHPSVDRLVRKRMIPDSEVFAENAAPVNGPSLTKRLLREGFAYECSVCGINEWLGRPLRLHLDHINGINNDNRRENLRLLCPNCHSQTDTYGRRPSKASEASHVLYPHSLASVMEW
ncbi:MAG: HNH endonuclease [Deltaproteobacteria bacterium]|nr:HNH endonuclease [Deltaproteobacteria bacterium]